MSDKRLGVSPHDGRVVRVSRSVFSGPWVGAFAREVEKGFRLALGGNHEM